MEARGVETQKSVTKQQDPIGRLLTIKELSDLLRVRPGTVYSWLSRGVDLPHIKIEGTVIFREAAVKQWLLDKETERKHRRFEA
jgi:excisionase family DNA binding protein